MGSRVGTMGFEEANGVLFGYRMAGSSWGAAVRGKDTQESWEFSRGDLLRAQE